MDILGTEHREQLKKGVEKRANLIKLAEHGSLRRDVKACIDAVLQNLKHCYESHWP